MQPSIDLCDTQERIHRDRAAASPLERVREVATAAADAWHAEGVLARRRAAKLKAAPAIERATAN